MAALRSRLLLPLLSLLPIASASSPAVPGLLQARDLPVGYNYVGCWTDVGRTIDAQFLGDQAMTTAMCINFCDAKGYAFAGTEYYYQCFCGQSLKPAAAKADDAQCNTPCNGNKTQACGGPDRLSLYYNSAKTGPLPNSGIAGWPYLGCYAEGTTGRTLTYGVNLPGEQANGANCTAACQTAGFTLAGTEYGGQCFCGNTFVNGGKPADGGCSMPCSGNSSEFCGGPDRLNVYSYRPGAPSSSPSPSSKPATLPVTTVSTPVAESSPVTTSSTVPASSAAVTSSAVPASSSVSPSTPHAPSTSSPAASASPGPDSRLPDGWSPKGCWQDGPNGRILPTWQAPDNNQLTPQSCAQLCDSRGYSVSGTEYFRQCFCANAVYNGGHASKDESPCNTPCDGDQDQMCGGPGYLSIISEGEPQIYQDPTVQRSGLNGTWTYQGCYVDATNPENGMRTLPWAQHFPKTMTATQCLWSCAQYGYTAAGLEYGEECYCGDPIDIKQAGSQQRPDSECNVICAGNASAYCGGGLRLSTYFWTGPEPLYVFDYPQGKAAGEYSLLVGGVVTPLITMQSITGKVSFLEKWGTGAPNSTGAYELDLSQVDHFERAWRTMHLKTDVFCAAALTLPDKAGRQLVVGGWSLDSTFGVRLYTPDGSDGVNGTNDWEEDVNQLRLQVGRWYPGALVMANGSVLVLGGEEGSNAAPRPSLEILPYTGTAPLYMDWLQRTDPNNLYPFMAVLRSGVFVVYWNEARILDDRTFETIRTLPRMPTAVNDPSGGRTYPLEGTAVLLPQHAPYQDPVGMLICGGSTAGHEALDNCATIYPEAAEPQWVLERMPSRRVLSCMAPLPDGTYLIANGAQEGVGGFGLADDPNLSALLYDPAKPVNRRVSVMASTTVARLYHSEAVTLLDGRVLISGSDPEDGKHPQEMRVEVFTPPYLLDGRPRPAFVLDEADRDWAHGRVGIPFRLARPPRNGRLQVSLLGAVGSTHGNSMGARTLFPAVRCGGGDGTSCTVDAPPDPYVAPPGWYQMFVLDGGVPAVGTFVRIGGDPAALGNWPKGAKFTRPGV